MTAQPPRATQKSAQTSAEARTERRLEALEVKASYADDLLDQLNHTVYQQQLQIDQLRRELALLRQQAQDQSSTPAFRSLRDELPPHY
jgi:SlyX protein